MKTTIELSDDLFVQAKASAKAQGISLKSLIEKGLKLAIHPKTSDESPVKWPDLTFTPKPTKAGYLIEPKAWRDAANLEFDQKRS